MSKRRLERGYWNGRQVTNTEKEFRRVYEWREDRGNWFFRFPVIITMDWPYPDEFRVTSRLPRKTKKALWKQFNGHPEADPRNGVLAYNGFSWGIYFPPRLFHNGKKP